MANRLKKKEKEQQVLQAKFSQEIFEIVLPVIETIIYDSGVIMEFIYDLHDSGELEAHFPIHAGWISSSVGCVADYNEEGELNWDSSSVSCAKGAVIDELTSNHNQEYIRFMARNLWNPEIVSETYRKNILENLKEELEQK